MKREPTSLRVTLKDIANATDLSVSSVSLALRGDKRFPPETVIRVQKAAQSLGYIYNQAAADLRTSRSNTIAVCVGDISNPIFNDMLISAENEIHKRGKRLLLGISRESRERQSDFLRQALQIGCEAILICPAYDTTKDDLDGILCHDSRLIVPTCLFFRSVEGFSAPQIVANEYQSGRLSARAALAAGHRRIFWIGGGHGTSSARLRRQGALDELARNGLQPEGVLAGPTSRAFGFDTARNILGRYPSGEIAFLCFSDLIALGVLAACHDRRRTVGQEVSVIGCDDMDEVKYAIPPLTTVRIELGRIVEAAMEAALGDGHVKTAMFEPAIVVRSSVRAHPGIDAASGRTDDRGLDPVS